MFANDEKKVTNSEKLNVREIKIYENVDEETFLNISSAGEPALIRNCCFGDCMKKWSLDFLEDELRNEIITIHESQTSNLDFIAKNFSYKPVLFTDFAQRLRDKESANSVYLRSINRNFRSKKAARIEDDFPTLSKDLKPPSFIPFGPENKLYHSSVLRIASANVQIWTHFDLYHNVLCQVEGSKRIILLPPEDIQYLYVEGDKSPINNFDDNFETSLSKYPLIKNLRLHKCLLNPGDTLFIPALWWHNIRTLVDLDDVKSEANNYSIGFNIFWKDQDVDLRFQYSDRDVYGNKNWVPFDSALANLDKAVEHLKKLPERYQLFYKFMLLERFKSKLFTSPEIV